MTKEPRDNGVAFVCDECAEELETEIADEEEARQYMLDEGWSEERGENSMLHYCINCTLALDAEDEEIDE